MGNGLESWQAGHQISGDLVSPRSTAQSESVDSRMAAIFVWADDVGMMQLSAI